MEIPLWLTHLAVISLVKLFSILVIPMAICPRPTTRTERGKWNGRVSVRIWQERDENKALLGKIKGWEHIRWTNGNTHVRYPKSFASPCVYKKGIRRVKLSEGCKVRKRKK
jgi:hypothetical protein